MDGGLGLGGVWRFWNGMCTDSGAVCLCGGIEGSDLAIVQWNSLGWYPQYSNHTHGILQDIPPFYLYLPPIIHFSYIYQLLAPCSRYVLCTRESATEANSVTLVEGSRHTWKPLTLKCLKCCLDCAH